MHLMQHSAWDNCALEEMQSWWYNNLQWDCWCNKEMYKFTADVAQHRSRVHFYILCPYISFLAHPNKHLLLRNGGKVASVILCFSANQTLSSLFDILSRLFSLIPFHTTRMVLPINNIADIHCVQTKAIISSLWLSHHIPCALILNWKQFY